MLPPIVDVDGFKAFLRERAQQTWDQRGIPYYLSMVATDLKRQNIDYHTFTGALRLVQWVTNEEIPDTKLVMHPTIKAKVGLLPASVDYDFSREPPSEFALAPRSTGRRGQALIKFVESLSVMPEDAAVNFEVPAKVLIALLKS
jgi:hypothetical protein